MPTEPATDVLQIPTELLPENIRPMATEINTYLRELPRLIAEGDEGRYALIRGNDLLSVWDTLGDALQAGYEKFGIDGEFCTQPIHARDSALFRRLLPRSVAEAG
ncbi:MAG: hypothetical protein U0746_18905 [Gemmataceae bacterium]